MLTPKLDLYKAEWLDLVFAKRNKDYGAYYLRQHYAGNLVKAMAIALFSITAIALAFGIAIKVKPETVFTKTEFDLKVYVPPTPPKDEVKKPEELKPSKPAPPQDMKKLVVMTPTERPIIEEPIKLKELENVAVGPTTVDAPGNGPAVNVDINAGKGGAGVGMGEDVSKKVFIIAEIMPQPVGGQEAWAKFLQKNLRYPGQAQSEGVGGKVYVSFIIEKDGHLSNITLIKGPGFGMDDEALRVLKLAPAWIPGVQNGQNVRVKYTIPINFSMGE